MVARSAGRTRAGGAGVTDPSVRIASGVQAPAVLAIGSLLALLTVLGAAGLLWHARQSDIDQWRQTAAVLSTTMTEHAGQTVRAADLVLQSIVIPLNDARIATEEDLWRTMDTPAIHEAIRNKVAAVPQVDVATIVDRRGDVINFNRYYPPYAPGTPGKRVNLADRDYFQAMMQGPNDGPFISAPVQNRVTGEWTFYLARQIRDQAGHPIGLVITGINSSFFEAFFRAVNIGKGSAISLYRGDGIMLARDPPAGAFIGRSFANQPLFRSVLQPGFSANAQVATDPPLVGRRGQLRIVAPLRLRDFPLVTNVTLSEDIVLANWRVMACWVGGLAVVLAASVLALSGLLARLLGRQHRTLADLARANAAAEAASTAKGQFLANMSHEIRTPMNAILGLVHLLQNRPLGPAELDMVRKIHNAGRSLMAIINDILDVSKIEAGRLEIEHAPFALGAVLDNVAAIMGAAVGGNPIELIIGPVPEGANYLKGDALRLEQVLVNLVGNAIKFTPAGEVALTVTLAGARAGEVDLRFAVRDTGVGIPPDKQEAIFSAFSQADGSTTRRFGGTGLGLTITRHIVTLMGGSISLTSAPGEGSEFSFVIPLVLDEPRGTPALPFLAGQRVLIADDHAVARDMLVQVARSMGWRTVAACSGDEAVARALAEVEAGTPFDALFLDWKMPGTDGLTAAARLRAALGKRQPPAIVMVTAGDREHLQRHALAGAVDAVLAKPITASAMYNAIGHASRHPAGTQKENPARHDRARLAGISVLVVDDSDINREVARHMLENEGARVLLAADGSQAVETLRAAPDGVDLVLMDVQMPVMDGYEATRHIRQTLHLAELPVVALTAGAFTNQQAAAFEAGMTGFVPKPFHVDDLIATVLRLAGPRPSLAAAKPPPAASPIDLQRGLSNWGDQTSFRKYLRLFAATHVRDGKEIARLLAEGRRKDAAALTHKLKGAAGSMALMHVWQQADSLEQTIHQGNDAASLVRDLQVGLQAACAAIAAYTGSEESASGPAIPVGTEVSPLVDALVLTLDRDDPAAAEPILDRLAGKLPAAQLAALRERLEVFDFRGAEAIAHALRARSRIGADQALDETASP